MSPTTFRGESAGDCSTIDWADHATIRRAGSSGVFHDFKILHQGTLAQMIAMLARMRPEERDGLIIEKSGDREIGPAEALELYKCNTFPGGFPG